MGLTIGSNFNYAAKNPLDSRDSFDTVLEMVSYPDTSLDEGHISYCKETNKHYKFLSTNEIDIRTGKWHEFNSGKTTDEKVAMNSFSDSKYLSELIDDVSIKIDSDTNTIYAVKIKDQTVTVAEVNMLQGIKSNIQEQINNLSKNMSMYGVFDTKAKLLEAMLTKPPSDGATAIVAEDETNSNKQMTYIYIASDTEWTPVSESAVTIRDFTINPINLAKEVTGVLPEEKIDIQIVRKSDLNAYLDKDTFLSEDNEGSVKVADTIVGLKVITDQLEDSVKKSHVHENKPALDKVSDEGNGDKFLTDKGIYKKIIFISDTPPEDTDIFWIDNTDLTELKLKIYDGIEWKEIAGKIKETDDGNSELTTAVTSNVDIGGISSGQTLPAGTTLDKLVEALLVKYYEPEVTMKLLPATEFYESGTSTTGIRISVSIIKKSNPISNVDFYMNTTKVHSIDIDTDPELPNGGEYFYTYNGILNKDTRFRVIVKDNKTSLMKEKSIKFVTPYYYGYSSNPMVNSFEGFYKYIGDKKDTSFSVTSSNKYIVFAYSSTYGNFAIRYEPRHF